MNVHEVKSIETKSILSRLKSKDNYWGIAYNMNLYRGCQHGCIYCDTRSSCYGVGDISHISVKKNTYGVALKPSNIPAATYCSERMRQHIGLLAIIIGNV